MEFDFWWLPGAALFFALGWLAARRDAVKQPPQQAALPETYVRGLQSLLGDDQVQAIDAFTELVRTEPDSLELHIALGHLFRRKGETDRAIRIHQNLLLRGDLSTSTRAQVQLELALDYIKAGLYDRAEQALQTLNASPLETEALRLRLDLAQRLRDWQLALSLCETLKTKQTEDSAGPVPPHLWAQLHAEIAQALIERGEYDLALRSLEQAQSAHPDHPRAWIDACHLFIQRDDPLQADALAHSIVQRWPEHAARIASAWLSVGPGLAADQSAATKRFQALANAFSLYPSYDVLEPLLAYLAKQQGLAAAQAFLRNAIQDPQIQPRLGLRSILALLQHHRASSPEDEALLKVVTARLEALAGQSGRYACKHCGFQANRHYWQCPGCNLWDRYPAQRADEIA